MRVLLIISSLGLLLMTIAHTQANQAKAKPAVRNVTLKGTIVDVHNFFELATKREGYVPGDADVCSSRAFVAKSAMYAFLETPGNAEKLESVELDSDVILKGKLLTSGALLHIESISPSPRPLNIRTARFQKHAGTAVRLSGRNLCQCALKLYKIPHSCALGHRHHLQFSGKETRIYHYLPTSAGRALFLGKDSHGKTVNVEAIILPGQFVLVKSVEK